ncbi:MAG: glycosyltransferase family 39 protein [Vicinamibacterales bacterium]
MRLRPVATACGLAGIAVLIFAFRLSAAPLSPAESDFNTQAQSIRAGNTPLFFHVRDEQWLQPAALYASAAIRAVGGDNLSGRLASVVAAALSVALLFLIAHEIAAPAWAGILASVTLMLTPAFWSFAQRGTDAMVPVPLVLLWLLNVLRFLNGDSLLTLALAAAMLGICAYAHPAGPLTALFLWLLTLVVARRRNRARLLMATAVFAAAWLPAAVWFLRHADTYPDTFGRWFVFAAHARSPVDGLRAFFNTGTLGIRASIYWGFWDPAWLFISTPESAAPLLSIAAPLIALGLIRGTRHIPRDATTLLVGAVLLAPLAGATFGMPHYVTNAIAVMPILALFCALGALELVSLVRRRAHRTYQSGDIEPAG